MNFAVRNQEICDLYNSGMTYREIGEAFAISQERCRQIALRAGTVSRRVESSITKQQLNAAIRRYKAGVPIAFVADEIGVSRGALFKLLVRRKVHTPSCEMDFWSDAEIAILKRHYKRDLSAREIGSLLKRTRNEVIGKAGRLGLSRRGKR